MKPKLNEEVEKGKSHNHRFRLADKRSSLGTVQ